MMDKFDLKKTQPKQLINEDKSGAIKKSGNSYSNTYVERYDQNYFWQVLMYVILL